MYFKEEDLPTAEFRWIIVERDVPSMEGLKYHAKPVLQQKWRLRRNFNEYTEEWRDVPTVVEKA